MAVDALEGLYSLSEYVRAWNNDWKGYKMKENQTENKKKIK